MSNKTPFTVSVKFAGAIYENPVSLEELGEATSSPDEEELINKTSDELVAVSPLEEWVSPALKAVSELIS
jgi:hypothetical protein